nr:LacI family DNA-binding transcriptional regulator [Rhizobium lemnae]
MDVATRAGVSAITVSRVLREPEKVSEQLRGRILGLIEDMGYVPDQAARALASRHNSTFGVLVSSLTNPAFVSFMQGVEERVRETNFRVQYANTHFCSHEEKRQVKLLLSQNTAGMILAGLEGVDAVKALLKHAACPVVQVVDIHLQTGGACIAIDHESAAATATRHLLDCGYRKIAIFGPVGDERGRRRLAGYRKVLQEAGLYDEDLVCHAGPATGAQIGAELLRATLVRHPDLDAVFCQMDDLALGVLFEAQRIGKRVPEDFGICGYNDLDFASMMEPPLTTIEVPLFDMGYRAADMMIRGVGGTVPSEATLDLGFRLVKRGTTRKSSPQLPRA